jgi:hypothetical protein
VFLSPHIEAQSADTTTSDIEYSRKGVDTCIAWTTPTSQMRPPKEGTYNYDLRNGEQLFRNSTQ